MPEYFKPMNTQPSRPNLIARFQTSGGSTREEIRWSAFRSCEPSGPALSSKNTTLQSITQAKVSSINHAIECAGGPGN
jgi:hypothetical protein